MAVRLNGVDDREGDSVRWPIPKRGRVGAEESTSAHPGVPNACDHCAHREPCHDAFGTSEDGGFGLYPFNDVALDRMVRSRQEKFNPRDLLAALPEHSPSTLRRSLTVAFPSNALGTEFDPRAAWPRGVVRPCRLTVQQQVDSLPKPEQRSVLLTFWGGVPDELCNLAAGIHRSVRNSPSAGSRRHSATTGGADRHGAGATSTG